MTSKGDVFVAGAIALGRATVNPWVQAELMREFRAQPGCATLVRPIEALRLGPAVYAAGFDVVSVAHPDLTRLETINDTVRTLQEAGVQPVGWGATPFGPVVVRRRGTSVAVCACVILKPETQQELGAVALSSLSDFDRFDELRDAVDLAAELADRVVVLIHDEACETSIRPAIREKITELVEEADIVAITGTRWPGEVMEGGRGQAFIAGAFHDEAAHRVVGHVGRIRNGEFEILPVRQTVMDAGNACTIPIDDELKPGFLASVKRFVGGATLLNSLSRRWKRRRSNR